MEGKGEKVILDPAAPRAELLASSVTGLGSLTARPWLARAGGQHAHTGDTAEHSNSLPPLHMAQNKGNSKYKTCVSECPAFPVLASL